MRLSHLLFVITTATAQSPFANTFDVSRAIRQFTTSFLNDLGETVGKILRDLGRYGSGFIKKSKKKRKKKIRHSLNN